MARLSAGSKKQKENQKFSIPQANRTKAKPQITILIGRESDWVNHATDMTQQRERAITFTIHKCV